MSATHSGTLGAGAAFAPGDVLDGRYELRSDLGRGATGLVFEARHQFTGRIVALKIVAPASDRAQLRETRARLVREARALAAVNHPGIVEVLDGGVLADGTPYFVMEKLEGRTLEGLLAARRKIAIEDAAAIGLQICDALGTAHKAGVVHRDLKPSNVFVVRERDGTERVKLVDFGTAQVADPETDEKLTGSGAVLGTPAYMAPEQLLAEPEVDFLADVYALGVTLVECVTGRVPYQGNYQKVLLQVCSDTPPPPIRQLFPDLDPALAPVLQRAVAKKRADRFPSAVEFARALHAAVPAEHRRTTLLGPPPVPRFAPANAPAADPRRKMPRAPYVTPVSLAVGGGTVDGRTEDISEGGILVITRQACEANQRAKVRFASPIEGRVVTCEAHVRWVRAAPPEVANGARAIGLEFIEASAEIRASIARYVAAMGEATGS
jgi:eukaryotic-like serine/threonine-protein kinase